MAKKTDTLKSKVISIYIKAVRKFKRVPTEGELRDLGLSRNTIRWHFENPKALKNHVKETRPEVFKNIIDEDLFTDSNMQKLEELVSHTKVAIVSAAVTGCKTHKGFLKAINSYAKKNEGTPLYIPVTDPASKAGWNICSDLGDKNIVFGDLALNSNIYISGIKMSAKQIDPTTGLDRMGHKMSFIFGSPKQRLKVKANSSSMHPHVSIGTGAVTLPNYQTERYMSERTAKLAQLDHVIGSLIVELDDNDKYYFREIRANTSGAFADLGKLYKPDGKVLDYSPEYFVMGDLHPGETDPAAFECWKEVISETKAKNVVVHDGFNGHSISHWLEGKIMDKAKMAAMGMTNLEQEGKICADKLKEILSWLPKNGKLYMVPSNHNDFLKRYLNDKRFVRDHENFDFVVKNLIGPAMKGEDPAKVLVEMFLTPKERSRIIWWDQESNFRYAGVLLSAHGDLGPNGSRGTLANQESSYGACIVGHSHTPGRYRDAVQVGTTTYKKLGYTKGPSSWMQTSALLYPNGAIQLINCIDGKWRLK